MRPTLYTVDTAGPGRLSTMAKPRAGDWLDDEMTELARAGVDVLVCLLTDTELVELDLDGEGAAAQSAGLAFLRLPVEDRGLPAREPLTDLVTRLVDARSSGAHVAVHCRHGIGRSSLVAAAVLVAEGADPDNAWQLVGATRGRSVPDTTSSAGFSMPRHGDRRSSRSACETVCTERAGRRAALVDRHHV